jgi:DNA-binding transcriptional LysR family regulator
VKPGLGDLSAFVTVARSKGFRDAARTSGANASSLSEAVTRLETQLGVRLLNRTTRSVVLTEAGKRLIERLAPALTEVESALDVVDGFRDRPAGTLRLNVPASAARLVLPSIVTDVPSTRATCSATPVCALAFPPARRSRRGNSSATGRLFSSSRPARCW